ncbi:hypothetical protein Trydic_g17185 [Trypoxylus dichotomus]
MKGLVREKNGVIPFLDVFVTRIHKSGLHHSVYQKPMHTDRYLHADFYHHPAKNSSVVNSLVRRVPSVSKPVHLSKQLQHIESSLQNNGCKYRNMQKVINKHLHFSHANRSQNSKNSEDTAYLPFIHGVTERTGRILRKQNKVLFMSLLKIAHIFSSPNDQV